IFLSEVVSNIIVFPLMFLSNAFFPSTVYPPIIRDFVEYQPLSIIITTIRDLILYNTLPNPVSVLIIVISTIIFIYIGSRLLRLREIN
ncbi:MAG: ABC transporter permease, partial [Saccharolobus sp.]